MKHTLYTLEKKQFHLEGYWLFAGVLFFCYVLSIQMNMQTIYLDLQNGRIPDSVTTVPFLSKVGILSTFGLCAYLNHQLFLISENGSIAPRISRYLTLPLTRKDYYGVKARIFFQKTGILLLSLTAMFHVSFLGFKLPLSVYLHSLPDLVFTCLFLLLGATLLFTGYLLYDFSYLKHHTI